MYERLEVVALRDGEQVEAGVISGPDAAWAPRIAPLLQHKGDPWNWQIAQFLEQDLDVDPYFYILHRDGAPFANIMTVEAAGVGLLGHVWTDPSDRRRGASSGLMAVQMQHFMARHGKVLFLGTEYNSVAYRMYERFGFKGVESNSDFMAYYATSEAQFSAEFFATGPVISEPLSWRHWPFMQPLFLGSWPGTVRIAVQGVVGRALVEEETLPMIRLNQELLLDDGTACATVLRHQDSQAVVGFAALGRHPMWGDMHVLDVYCHPDYWDRGARLLNSLAFFHDRQIVAYGDPACQRKIDLLVDQGFAVVSSIPRWLHADAAKRITIDLLILRRDPV